MLTTKKTTKKHSKTVSITAHGIDWSIVSQVSVTLQYGDPSGHRSCETLHFTETANTRRWVVPFYSPNRPTFFYQCCYTLSDGGKLAVAPRSTAQTKIDLNHPFSNLPIEVLPCSNEGQLRSVLVDIAYEDADNDYMAHERLAFSQNQRKSTRIQLPVIDPSHRRFRYRVSVVSNDGQLARSRFIETEESVITIQPMLVQVMAQLK